MATKKYSWSYDNVGGSTRVKITKGTDIENLAELDYKKWTVLSCPTVGLEINDKCLKYVDADNDGRIRVNDIIATSQWLVSVVNDADLLVKGADSIDVSAFNQENADGKRLYNSARQILANLGKEGDVISLADTKDIAAIFAKTRFNGDGVITEQTSEDTEEKTVISAIVNTVGCVADRSGENGVDVALIEKFYQALADYVAWQEAAVAAPCGADTDKAVELYSALDAKVKDYFVRAKLASFSPESVSKLDVQTGLIEAISTDNLTAKTEEIASCPIARITGDAGLDTAAAINPAWESQLKALLAIVKPVEKVLTEESWAAIGASFAEYNAWKAAKKGGEVEGLGADVIKKMLADDKKAALLELVAKDLELKETADGIDVVDKFMHIYHDFYRLLCNYVTFQDFYNKDKSVKAIFQCGHLLIDQRECRLCMNVADMAKHNAMAPASGMYLVYCDCTTKSSPVKKSILAAVTSGEVGDLFVGKNAIYFDNAGVMWDAVITKIVDNPISIGQAFWSPYRRMATTIENLINKSAAEKDAAMMKNANDKINAAPTVKPAEGEEKVPAQPFDIAKFAGIFAAIGMAVGMIGTALASIFKGFIDLSPWQMVAVFVGILLLISGPAMVMAWMKLRRRNIAPLLNANGWAINAAAKISIPFGETLTEIAKFPKLKLKDPYAKKGLPAWLSWLLSLLTVAVVVAGLWLGNVFARFGYDSPLFEKESVEVVEEAAVAEDTVVAEPAEDALADGDNAAPADAE